jgi:predicted MFS family arabinose efflux permease
MSTNLVPLLIDRGFAAPTAAKMASLFGLAVIAGRIILGSLVDRFWAPRLAFLFLAPAALATWVIANTEVGFGPALVLIATVGLATGAEGDLLSYLVTRYFGIRAYGRIFSGVFVAFIAAIAIAAPLFGRSYDVHGSYGYAMTWAAAAWLACGLLFLTLGPYPRWPAAERTA